jgi:hypothetical protein
MKNQHVPGVVALAASMLIAVGQANADVVITAVESGGDVVFSSPGGAFDLSALSHGGGFGMGSGFGLSHADFSLASVGLGGSTDFYTTISAPANFGAGGLVQANSATGPTYGASGPEYGTGTDALLVPPGYVSGDTLGASTSTFVGQSFASMGITEGSYVWSWGAGGRDESLTLNIVPAPATAGLFGLAAFGFGFSRRRK